MRVVEGERATAESATRTANLGRDALKGGQKQFAALALHVRELLGSQLQHK